MRYYILLLSTMLLLAKTGMVSATPLSSNDTTQLSCKDNAAHLLEEALNIMQKNYYKRTAISWEDLRGTATERLASAGSCEEAFEVITWCLSQLDEKHSYIMPTPKAAVYNYDTTLLVSRPALKLLTGEIKAELIDDSIGYISVPWISTTDSVICTLLADSLQNAIARLDQQGVSKWIVDLRKNTGGNCWPMLAGIGPLLGDGTCGYFISDNSKIAISYRNGASYQGRYVRCQATGNGYRTRVNSKRIAVLTGSQTSSSGELLALAFKGKDQTYIYGEPTAGLTTANATYTLSDHSMLVLTVCREADRTGKICFGKVQPDEKVSTAGCGKYEDPVKGAALMWLQSF
ncbi:MAG: S41 family peptidase [Chitinophagaceae bacterium]